MKKRDEYEKFASQCLQQIDDLQSESKSILIKRFRKSRGLGDDDTLALLNLDVDGPEFLTSGKPRDGAASEGTQFKRVDALAVVCDE